MTPTRPNKARGALRLIPAEQARRRGLGAIRGVVIALFWSSLFWAVLIVAYVVGQRWPR
jgi:hypothetical protein